MLLLPTDMDFSHNSIYPTVTDNENLKISQLSHLKKSELVNFTLLTQVPLN